MVRVGIYMYVGFNMIMDMDVLVVIYIQKRVVRSEHKTHQNLLESC